MGAMVGEQVARKLGLDPDPAMIAQAISDPAVVAKLAEIEATADVELAKLEVQDRMDARTNIRDDRMRRILALFLPLAALLFGTGAFSVLISKNMTGEALGLAGTILGWLIRDASAATSFFFGSSVGSSRKAAELSQERK
jgi:hypothetical protein